MMVNLAGHEARFVTGAVLTFGDGFTSQGLRNANILARAT